MGSLTSRPKIPAAPKPVVISVPAPAATPSPAAVTNISTPAGNSVPDAPEPTDEQVQEEARKSNLLSRSRGAFSTVLTGFRGILSDSNGTSGRKTLLGE